MAIIDHFRARGALVVATTHYDALKTYAATTPASSRAAFGFDPETFAPTYRLIYGSPGRSLALEMAARLGLPAVDRRRRARAAATARRSSPSTWPASTRTAGARPRAPRLAQKRASWPRAQNDLRARVEALSERESAFSARLDEKLEQRLRDAQARDRRVVEDARAKAARSPTRRVAAPRDRGSGITRSATIDRRDRPPAGGRARRARPVAGRSATAAPATPARGCRRAAAGMPLESASASASARSASKASSRRARQDAEVDVNGKRMRARSRTRVIGGAGDAGAGHRARQRRPAAARSGRCRSST